MNQRLKQYKKIRIILSVLLVVILLIGTSFAIFQNFARQSGTNNLGATNCFSVTFEGVNSAINLANDYPIPDSEGLERDPYTFKVTNNCNQYLTLSIGVETLSTSEIPSNLIKGVIVSNGGTPTSASILSSGKTMEAQNGGTAYELLTDVLAAKASKTYDLRLWFDESMTKEQGASKKYQGKVIVGASASVSPTFAETILANNKVQTPLTTPGKEVSAYKESEVTTTDLNSVSSYYQKYYFTYGTGWEANGTKFNLTGASVTSDTYANSYSSLVGKYIPFPELYNSGSQTAGTMKTTTNLSSVYYVVSATQNSFTYKVVGSNKNTTEALLASAEDDYGTSYYFRGTVKNNYVEFANKCWRIVRVGGDGSVKLILHNDNKVGVANPCAVNNSTNAAFARYSGETYKSSFNPNYNDNAYVGFKYGTAGSNTYEATHANTNNSTILTNLETWYNNNLKTYESVIDDNVWCNDKTNVTDTSYNPWSYDGENATGLGYGTNKTYYGATQRLVSTSNSAGSTGPSLKCNGELSKINSKVGLITADELAYAGYAYVFQNTATYLQENATDTEWWSLSPFNFINDEWYGADVWVVDGINGGFGSNVKKADGVRPSISLKSTTNVTGEGTSENPYKVV